MALNDIWTGRAEREYGSARAYLDSLWSPRTRSRAEELDAVAIRRVCDRLDEVAADWRTRSPGEELRVAWQGAASRGGSAGRAARARRPRAG